MKFRSNRLLPHAAIVVAGFLTLTTLAILGIFAQDSVFAFITFARRSSFQVC